MFRRKEVIVIRERRRMSGVQMLATGVALLGLIVVLPHFISAAKVDAFPFNEARSGQNVVCNPQPCPVQ